MPKSLLEVADAGDNRELLEELKRQLCRELDECTSQREYASLSMRLMQVVQLLGVDPKPWTGTNPLNELQRRRAGKLHHA